jgi:hypothetical protein
MKRSKFIKQVSSLMIIGVPLLGMASSCTKNVDPTPRPPINDANCLLNGTSANIGANHGHTLTVSKTDVENAAEKTYAIQGTASHDHEVIISTTNFSALKGNQSIQVVSSSSSGHTHSVSVSCA